MWNVLRHLGKIIQALSLALFLAAMFIFIFKVAHVWAQTPYPPYPSRQEEIQREPSSLYIVTVVVGVLTAMTNVLTNISSFIESFNSTLSRLPIPDKLKEFLKLYSEKLFETVDEHKLEALGKAPFITKKEGAALGIYVLVMMLVFGFVEANGLPYFLDLSILTAVIPAAFLSVCIVLIVDQLSEFICARAFKVYRQLKLWMVGLVAFLISGLAFLIPFSSPLIMRYQSGEIPKRTKGLIVLSKMFVLLTLTIPFTSLYLLGYHYIGDVGLLLTFMTVFYSLVPLNPLPGKAVFEFHQTTSLVVLASTALLFFSHAANLLPHVAYLVVGVVSAFLVAVTLNENVRVTLMKYLSRIKFALLERKEHTT